MTFWDDLAGLARTMNEGEIDFPGAASAIGAGATTERWPMAPIREVAGALGPLVFERIKDAPPGVIVGPIQDGPRFWLVMILGDEPIRPMTFDEAQQRLKAEILRDRRAAARVRIISEMLSSHDFQLIPNTDTDNAAQPDS